MTSIETKTVSVLPYAVRGGFRLFINSMFFKLVAGQDLIDCSSYGIFVACRRNGSRIARLVEAGDTDFRTLG